MRLTGIVLCLALALPSTTSAQPSARVKTVIVGLQARRGIDPGLAQALSDVVQGVFASDKGRIVLGRTDIVQVMGFETERQALGCDDASCLSEVASALDADRLITGSMDRIGSSYLVVISEFDAKKLVPVARVERQLKVTEDQLVDEVRKAAGALLEQTRVERHAAAPPPLAKAKTKAAGDERQAARAADDEEEDEADDEEVDDDGESGASGFTYAFGGAKVATGALSFLCGGLSGTLGLLLLAPTSSTTPAEDLAYASPFLLGGGCCCLLGAGLCSWGICDFVGAPSEEEHDEAAFVPPDDVESLAVAY